MQNNESASPRGLCDRVWRRGAARSVRARYRPQLVRLEERLCLSLGVSLGDLTGVVGTPFSVQAVPSGSSAADGYTYSLTTPPGSPPHDGLPPGLSFADSGLLSGTPTAPGSYDIVIQVQDSTTGATGLAAIPLSIRPLITVSGNLSGDDAFTPLPNGPMDELVTASDPASNSYTFTLSGEVPDGLVLEQLTGTTAQLEGTPTQWGTYPITVTATATTASGVTGSQVFDITVTPPFSFSPGPAASDISTNSSPNPSQEPIALPLFDAQSQPATVGVAFNQAINITSNLPAEMLSTVIIANDNSGQDGGNVAGGTDTEFTWNGLTFMSSPTGVVISGTPTAFTNTNVAQSIPPMELLVTATGSGSTPVSQQAIYLVNVEPAVSSPFSANHGQNSPFIQIQPEVNGAVMQTLSTPADSSYSVTFLPNAGDGYTFNLITPEVSSTDSGSVPPGMQFYPSTGILSGTPTQPGVYNLVIQVTNPSTGVIDSAVFPLTVTPPSSGLQLSPLVLPQGSPAVFYDQTITASGASDVALTWQVNDDGISDLTALGLYITQNPGDPGSLTISGTPTFSTPDALGNLELTVKATDFAGASTEQTYAISIYYTPQQIAQIYGVNQVILSGGITGNGAGQTIAIVDEGDAPNLVSTTDPNFANSDLARFDTQFNLANPPSFLKVDAYGGTNYPSLTSDHSGETTLDVEWAHALAPQANIILFEGDLTTALQTLKNFPAISVVSVSYGFFDDGTDDPNTVESGYDPLFTPPQGQNITYLVASGDADAGSYSLVQYPGVSSEVVSVGYTALTPTSQGGWSESAVANAGGGASVQELQPTWQNGVVGATSTTMRADPDVVFNGSGISGMAEYDSAAVGTGTPWVSGNGSSIATPSWAALIAIADQGRMLLGLAPLNGTTETLPTLYALAASGSPGFHNIDTTTNGTVISPAFGAYNPWSGLGSPIANYVIPALVGGQETIEGAVVDDLSGTGAVSANDPRLGNQTVFIDTNGNGRLDPGEPTTTTDADGGYEFEVAPGTYSVRLVVPPGLTQTTVNPAAITFSPDQTGSHADVVFGLSNASSPIPTPVPAPTPTPIPTPAPAGTPLVVEREARSARQEPWGVVGRFSARVQRACECCRGGECAGLPCDPARRYEALTPHGRSRR